MTKKELIEQLKEIPDDTEILIKIIYDDGYAIAMGQIESIKKSANPKSNAIVLSGYDC